MQAEFLTLIDNMCSSAHLLQAFDARCACSYFCAMHAACSHVMTSVTSACCKCGCYSALKACQLKQACEHVAGMTWSSQADC